MLCKCGAIPERNTGRCPDCRRQQQAEYMRRKRAEVRTARDVYGYDPAAFAGSREKLQEIARRLGMVR